MKYPSQLLVVVFGLTLVAACQSRDRSRPRIGPGADSAVSMDDGGGLDDADVPDGTATGDAGVDDGGDDGGLEDARVDDSGPPSDSSVPVDSGPADTGPPTCTPTAGSLAIVEVMIASQGGSDQGEWFEVVNASSCALDLSGLEIGSPTTDGTPVTHTVSMGVLAPGAHHVFALSGDPVENHDLPWDYVYGTGTRSDVFLGNAGDVLTIAYLGVELDRVEWTAEDYLRGATLQYPRGASLSANGDIGLWCNARRVYSTSGGGTYLGTPGASNDTCP